MLLRCACRITNRACIFLLVIHFCVQHSVETICAPWRLQSLPLPPEFLARHTQSRTTFPSLLQVCRMQIRATKFMQKFPNPPECAEHPPPPHRFAAGTSSATTPGASIVVSPMAAPLTTAVEGTETTDSNCKRSCYSHPVLERDDVIRAFSLERPFVVARYTKPGEPRPGHAIQYRCSCKNGAKQEFLMRKTPQKGLLRPQDWIDEGVPRFLNKHKDCEAFASLDRSASSSGRMRADPSDSGTWN